MPLTLRHPDKSHGQLDKMRILSQQARAGASEPAFLTSSRGCCCWSLDHILNNKDQEHFLLIKDFHTSDPQNVGCHRGPVHNTDLNLSQPTLTGNASVSRKPTTHQSQSYNSALASLPGPRDRRCSPHLVDGNCNYDK